jgi:hypothetical protein
MRHQNRGTTGNTPQTPPERSRRQFLAGTLTGGLLGSLLAVGISLYVHAHSRPGWWSHNGIARRQKYSTPITEAVDFIRMHSRFQVAIDAIGSPKTHTFTYYNCPAGRQTCVLVNEWDLDQSVWDALPTRDFYMLLWEAGDHPPLLAGGTWGIVHGVPKGGINRPYITIPVDP